MPVFSATIKSLRRFIPSLIIHLGLFLLFASLFAYFGADTTSEIFRESALNVTVVDLEDSENSRGLIRFLSEDEKVTVEKRKSLNLEDRQKLNDSVRFDVSDFVLILPKDFSEKLKVGDDHAAAPSNMAVLCGVDNKPVDILPETFSVIESGIVV